MESPRLHPRRPSAPVRVFGWPTVAAIGVGALVAYDASIGHYHPLWQFALGFEHARNYLWTATGLVLAMAAFAVAMSRDWLASNRYRIAAAVLVAAPALSGLNIGRLDPTDFAAAGVGFFWLVTVLAEDRPIRIPRSVLSLLLGIGIFGAASIVNGGASVILTAPAVALKLLLVFLLASLIHSPRDLETALKVLVVVALASGSLAIVIEVAYFTTGFEFSLDDRAEERFKCLGSFCVLRASSVAASPQSLGHLLIMGAALSLFMPARVPVRLVSVAGILVGAVLTFSHGVVLSTAIVFLVAPFLRWPGRYRWIALGYAATAWVLHVTGIGAMAVKLAFSALSIGDGVTARISTYQGALEHIVQHPILGKGALKRIPGSLEYDIPHNAFLQIAFELGIPAACLFTFLVLYLFVRCGMAALAATDRSRRRWLTGLWLGLMGMLIHFMGEPFYTSHLPWMYMGLATSAVIFDERTGTHRRNRAVFDAATTSSRDR